MNPIKGTVNWVELIGYLTDDPEDHLLPSGTAYVAFTVGTKRPSIQQEDGSWMYDTELIPCEAIDKLAEMITMNLRKGARVRVTGNLRSQSWDDKGGVRHKRMVVRAEDAIFLDARSSIDEAVVADASE